MNLALAELLTRLSGVVAVVSGSAAAVAAVLRFWTWWKDRRLAERFQAAESLKVIGPTPVVQEAARRQCIRLRFMQFTGLDRTDGYDELIACHQKLGGTDQAWARMRRAGKFLETEGGVAVVQAFSPWTWWKVAAAVVACAVLALASFALLVFAAAIGPFAKDVTIAGVYFATIVAMFASVPAAFAYVLAAYAAMTLDANRLRRELNP